MSEQVTAAGILVWWRGAAALSPSALREAVTTRLGAEAARAVPRRDDKRPATALRAALPRRSSRVGAFWRLLDADDTGEAVAVFAQETADATVGTYDAHASTVVRVDRATGAFSAAGPHVEEAEKLRARYDAERGTLGTTDVGRVIVQLLSLGGAVLVSPGIYLAPKRDTVDAIDRALDDATVACRGERPALRFATVSGEEAERLAPDVDEALGTDLARLVVEAEALAAEVTAAANDVNAATDEGAKRARRQALVASKRLERLDALRGAIRGMGLVLGARQQRLEARAAACEAVLTTAARSCLGRVSE